MEIVKGIPKPRRVLKRGAAKHADNAIRELPEKGIARGVMLEGTDTFENHGDFLDVGFLYTSMIKENWTNKRILTSKMHWGPQRNGGYVVPFPERLSVEPLRPENIVRLRFIFRTSS